MTNQEIYDKIVSHLRMQNCKSQNEERECLYRGPNGTKCAAGCLISDEEYSYKMEGLSWGNLIEFSSYFIKYENNFNLIERMQVIHDEYQVKYWEEQFQLTASEFDLLYSA